MQALADRVANTYSPMTFLYSRIVVNKQSLCGGLGGNPSRLITGFRHHRATNLTLDRKIEIVKFGGLVAS